MNNPFSRKTAVAVLAAGLLLTGCTSTAPSSTATATWSTAGTSGTGTPTTPSSGAPTRGATTTKSGSGTSTASPGKTGATTAAPGLPTGVTAATSIPTSAPNKPALRANVRFTSCKSIAGGWGATGTATNPSKKNINYTITVFFTTTSATVINTTQTKVTVKAGEKKTWTVSRKFAAPPKMLCVMRGIG